MLKPTKPFKDTVTDYPKEPSLRIGRTVPRNSVNLAYYFNPTATDAEKIMAAEAPRTTIDHRVEEAYRYLHDMPSDDDDQFPGSVYYEDEEGYTGRLARMYTQWFPKHHVLTKNISATKTIRVTDKSDVPKMYAYDDAEDYHGYYYLDAIEWSVCKYETVITETIMDREVLDFELSYKEIFGSYVSPANVTAWVKEPTLDTDTVWPRYIDVGLSSMTASGGNGSVVSWIANYGRTNHFDDGVGRLMFKGISYEQVDDTPASSGSSESPRYVTGYFYTEWYDITALSDVTWPSDLDSMTADEASALQADIESALRKVLNDIILMDIFKENYEAKYDEMTDNYDYTEIDDWLTMAKSEIYHNTGASAISSIELEKANNSDIAIWLTDCYSELEDDDTFETRYRFKAKYKYALSKRASEGGYKYNVVANYEALKPNALKKIVKSEKEVPAQYEGICTYVGIARKTWDTFDGMAYYRGAVVKGNAMGNVNPDGDDELLMFSDGEGYLRRPVRVYDEVMEDYVIRDFYRVEADYIYLTDVFKDEVACFYKYPLKRTIYDYRGPDKEGFYEGDSVKMSTAAFKNLPPGYKYNTKLVVAKTEEVEVITDDFTLEYKRVPKCYYADLYCNFVSGATDTFKAVYNAFSEVDHDNLAIDSGATEDVYNYPFMYEGIHYQMEPVDIRTRCNRIKLIGGPRRIEDTRRWVSFGFVIYAERKQTLNSDGSVKTPAQIFVSDKINVSILNRDYAVKAEYKNFEGRGYIVSPVLEDYYASPMDICLKHQSLRSDPPIVHRNDTDLIFYTKITEIADTMYGAVNLKCNPDGSGYITAETTVDTGFYNEDTGLYNIKLSIDNPYWLEAGYIYPGFKVKCVDSRHIKVKAPREDALLDSWYPMVQFGHYSQIMDQYGTHVKVSYTMPEYDTQHYSATYGKPYVDVEEEKVTILNSHMIKTKCYPLHVIDYHPDYTIKIWKRIDDELFPIKIKDVSFKDGIIVTTDSVSENDDIITSYTYVEENYVYRGFWRNIDDFVRVDLNPNIYHTYNDPGFVPSEVKPSKNLFNKVLYFFLKPTVVYEVSSDYDGLIYDLEDDADIGDAIVSNEGDCLYHQIDNVEPASDMDIYIGSIYIRQNTSLHSTILVDSRTRGGGVLTSITDKLRHELEPESDYYLDIGYFDGEPYQENGVIIVRLDQRLLKEFGGRFTQGDIEAKVKRWLGFGIYPIIEYVNAYGRKDLPQYTLEVEDTYTNIEDLTPEFVLECVEV